jgi:hypothetical protein
MDWITIIKSLLPLLTENVPAAEQDVALAGIALELIDRIKSQKGMTTDQIIERAGVTLAANKIKLEEDKARLGSGGGSGGGSESGGNP